jgi:hypothetical protein
MGHWKTCIASERHNNACSNISRANHINRGGTLIWLLESEARPRATGFGHACIGIWVNNSGAARCS